MVFSSARHLPTLDCPSLFARARSEKPSAKKLERMRGQHNVQGAAEDHLPRGSKHQRTAASPPLAAPAGRYASTRMIEDEQARRARQSKDGIPRRERGRAHIRIPDEPIERVSDMAMSGLASCEALPTLAPGQDPIPAPRRAYRDYTGSPRTPRLRAYIRLRF